MTSATLFPLSSPVLLVTQNVHKFEEFKRIVPQIDWRLLCEWEKETLGEAGPDVIEDADSFAGNALLKSRAGHLRSGQVVVADDSGLCVDALGGAPGIYSARYAEGSDRDRYEKLLHELREVPQKERSAAFHCAITISGLSTDQRSALNAQIKKTPIHGAHIFWDHDCFVIHARCHGEICHAPQGEQGFGYDPVFMLASGQSMASLSGPEKDLYSHRGIALRAFSDLIFMRTS